MGRIERPAPIMAAALLVCFATGCRPGSGFDEDPPSLEPRALASTVAPSRLLTQSSIDALVPDWSDSYTAWWVEWEGSRPARVTIERYRRGSCFERADYLHLGHGELHRQSLEAQSAVDEADAASMDDVLVPRLVNEISLGDADWYHRRDVAGRLIYAFRRVPAELESTVDVEVIVRVDYVPEACTLKQVLRTREVPAKETPAGRSSAPPSLDP